MDTRVIASQFQLRNSLLTKLNISNSFTNYSENAPGQKTIDVTYKVVDIVRDDSCYHAVLDLTIDLRALIKRDRFHIKATMRGFFDCPANCSESDLLGLLRINGCAALYSMARGTISIISTQMFSFGNIVLPLVNFVKFREIEEKLDTDSKTKKKVVVGN